MESSEAVTSTEPLPNNLWNIDALLKDHVLKCLKANGYKRLPTAVSLGVSKRTLERWLKQWNMQRLGAVEN